MQVHFAFSLSLNSLVLFSEISRSLCHGRLQKSSSVL